MKIDKRNYKGKKIFVGMDVHKNNYAIAVTCEGVIVKNWSMKADNKQLLIQLKEFFPGANIYSAYEAGFSGFGLHRFLTENGVENIVVNPGSIAVESNSRVKTDKKDAKKISQQLSIGLLRGIFIPSREQEDRRSLTRGRDQIVKRRQAIGNQIKMKIYYLGLFISDSRISETYMKKVEQLKLSPGHQLVLTELVASWRVETERIKRFNQALKEQAQKDSLDTIYRSAPGVGAISSRVLSNELGDMSRFDNVRQLSSSTGLTPSEYSSGQHVRKGHVTRQGSPQIRAILVEIAWRAIREDQNLMEIYHRIRARREGKRAIIAIARKILIRLRKCFKDNKLWKDLGPIAI